ncbi:1407_t:CDS:1, partial [Racocetra persica]
ETYINFLPLLKNCKLKKQSRLNVNENIRSGLIILKCVEEAIDYISWKTIQGQVKLTNKLDDLLELTDKGHARVAKIKQGLALDLIV